jgi:hypothetical protein
MGVCEPYEYGTFLKVGFVPSVRRRREEGGVVIYIIHFSSIRCWSHLVEKVISYLIFLFGYMRCPTVKDLFSFLLKQCPPVFCKHLYRYWVQSGSWNMYLAIVLHLVNYYTALVTTVLVMDQSDALLNYLMNIITNVVSRYRN